MPGTVKEAHLSFPERCLRYFSYCVVSLVQRPKVCGPAKPALDQPTIFVGRHVGLMDPVILMTVYFKYLLHPTVARDYADKNRFTQKFYKAAQCITLDRRNTANKQWLTDATEALSRGESIIIFPEGKRNKSGKPGLLPFHSGAVLLAVQSGARLIPVYNKFWKFPHRYRLAIGEPFYVDPVPEGGITADWLREQREIVREKVAALEPLAEGTTPSPRS